MQKFNLNKKLWVSTKELMKITSFSDSRIFRYSKEWIKSGNDPRDMGRMTLKGKNVSYLWDLRIFANWVLKYKVEQPIKYDYELAERETLKKFLVYNNPPVNQERKAI
jgi:hypothetical protein